MNKLPFKILIKVSVFFILAFSVFILQSFVQVTGLSKSYNKKISKTLVELWPGSSTVIKDTSIPNLSVAEFEQLGVLGIFEVVSSENTVGFAVLAKARSKFDDFEYMIYYDQNKSIKAVRVMVYREDYGGEIASKRWLKQFVDKTSESPIEIDRDIQGISGATISYRAITTGIKNITLLMNKK